MKQVIAGVFVLAAMAGLVPSSAAGASDAATVPAQAQKKRLSDEQIRQILIAESIAGYPGNCPCPYSRARNGSRCGRRSAYSREGGEAPLCFPKDVTSEMVRAYRESNAEP